MFNYSPAQAWAHFQPPVVRERIDQARLDLLCCRYVGPRIVTNNGVSHRGIDYGRGDPKLLDLQGRKVWLKLDPERADRVQVCDHATRRLLCVAAASDIRGATQADVRDHQRAKARRKRAVRAEADTRHVDLDTSVDGVIRAQLARAQSRQVLLREAAGPERIQLVRPDVSAEVVAASKRVQPIVEPYSDEDAGGNILSIYADLANVERAADDDVCDDGAAAVFSLADLADLPTGQDDPGPVNGFAILADLAASARTPEARYGTAG
jgi:hypothetical protein